MAVSITRAWCAALANLGRVKSQGASTIAMYICLQRKHLPEKIYEILLTFKLEHLLSKNQILEIYMNQIYLGNRAYGFSAASEAYFGKPLKSVSVAEAAMLAGLPKAPSAYNPISNPSALGCANCTSLTAWSSTYFITPEQAA